MPRLADGLAEVSRNALESVGVSYQFSHLLPGITCVFFFQAEDGIRDLTVTGVQTCALPISFDAGNYTIEGETVSGPEFLRRAGVYYLSLGGSALAAAYAIWRERSWSRWAIVVFWIAQLAAAVGFGWAAAGMTGVAGAVASLLLLLVLVGWYLFDKENVVTYYRSLEKLEAAEHARRGKST